MIKTEINDKYALMLPKHRAARSEWKTGWEVKRIDSMIKNLRPDDFVLDVGTEEGDISALLAKHVPKGGMYLVEPNPNVWPNVRAIWEANELNHPELIFVGFLGKEKNEHKGLNYNWPSCAYDALIDNHGFKQLWDEGRTLPVSTVDDLITSDRKINLITIDVEGAEFEVLLGAEKTLKYRKPLVFVSIHPEFMFDQYKQYTSELLRYMQGLGYELQLLDYDHELHVLFYHPEGRRPVL